MSGTEEIVVGAMVVVVEVVVVEVVDDVDVVFKVDIAVADTSGSVD